MDTEEIKTLTLKMRVARVVNYFKSLSPVKLFILITLLVIIAVIPLTVFLTQQKTNLNQHASESTNVGNKAHESRIKYDQKTELAQSERIKNGKKNLIKKDLDAKKAIISKVPTSGLQEGIVFVSQDIAIQYDRISDDFTTEILNSNINEAKAEAENWFRQQGISTPGICNLPLSYIMSPEVFSAFPEDMVFSSAPLACK